MKHKNLRKIILFVFLYCATILLINLTFVIIMAPSWDSFLRVMVNLLTPTIPAICNLGPDTEDGFFKCSTSLGLVIFNIFAAILSYVLVFHNKLKLRYWIIFFVFLNILVQFFLRLKDVLYVNW